MNAGVPPHEKGPAVWMNMDQVELDASYDQNFYAPAAGNIRDRYNANSDAVRARLGDPRIETFGSEKDEKLEIYKAKKPNAPIFVFIHGGAWLAGTARRSAYPAEMFVNAGATSVPVGAVSYPWRAAREALTVLRVDVVMKSRPENWDE